MQIVTTPFMEDKERIICTALVQAMDFPVAEQRIILGIVKSSLGDDYFTGIRRVIYRVFLNYMLLFGRLPTMENIDWISSTASDVITGVEMKQEIILLKTKPVVDRTLLKQEVFVLSENVNDVRFSNMLADSSEVFKNGKIIDGKPLAGRQAAVDYLRTGMAQKLSSGLVTDFADSDMRETIQYHDSLKNPVSRINFQSGIPFLDSNTGGLTKGELWTIGAYSGEGKSFLSVHLYYQAIRRGYNCAYFTSETRKVVVKNRLAVRHAQEPQFLAMCVQQGCDPIRNHPLLNGQMTERQKIVFNAVLDDLEHNPSYGKPWFVQMPAGYTFQQLKDRAESISAESPLDVIVVDYLNTLKSTQDGLAGKVEQLQDAKAFASSFNENKGVILISPWQISNEGRKRLQAAKIQNPDAFYVPTDFGDTSESVRSSDVAIGLDLIPEKNIVRMGIVKNREGKKPLDIARISVDYDRTMFFPDENNLGDLQF